MLMLFEILLLATTAAFKVWLKKKEWKIEIKILTDETEKLISEERRLNAKNEKREEDDNADQMEKSESHPVGRRPAWRMKMSHDWDSKTNIKSIFV